MQASSARFQPGVLQHRALVQCSSPAPCAETQSSAPAQGAVLEHRVQYSSAGCSARAQGAVLERRVQYSSAGYCARAQGAILEHRVQYSSTGCSSQAQGASAAIQRRVTVLHQRVLPPSR